MISTSDFRNGITIIFEGDLYTIVDFLHVKIGRGGAYVRTKLKNLKSGRVLEKTFNAGEKVEHARIDTRKMQYLYKSGDEIVLMDVENYEQINLPISMLGDGFKWLKEGMQVQAADYEGKIIGVDLPTFVELEVIQTDPGFKGDTATGGTKPAELETGATINVPLFLKIGDVIQIDTRTGEYLKRA